jgi:hypothetical protein
MVGVVAGVQTPSGKRSMAFAARIGLAHSAVGSGGLFTEASDVTMLKGPRTDGQ